MADGFQVCREIKASPLSPPVVIVTAESDDDIHQYKVEGVGEDFWPETVDPSVVDEFIMVTDTESFITTRRLAREEGLLVGGSCGMAAHAALQVADRYDDRLVVVLLPDSGRGYLSKVFNDDWLRENGFEAVLEAEGR